MGNMLYDALIGRWASETDRHLIDGPGQRQLSYPEMDRRAALFAGGLAAIGLEPGARVSVQVRKSVDALALYLACLRHGAVFVPLNTAYTAAEMAYFIEDAAPGLLVCDPSAEPALQGPAAKAGAALLTMDAAGSGTFRDRAEAAGPSETIAECGPEDLACFLYTSGTTGRSKGAMLTHANLMSNAEVLARTWGFTAQDRLLHALPIFHAHGLFVACNVAMSVGGSMIWLPGFETDAVLEALPRATVMMGVPTFYARLLATDGLTPMACRHMRLFTSGSAPLLAETHEAFSTRTGHKILERYGMTETGMNTSNPYDGERRPGTVGFPLDGVEVRICAPGTDTVLPQGETGMIEVRGRNVFKGYWRKPEKTAEELRETGFFITGDLGRIDGDGYVQIVGRKKDLIISGGYNVYPKEVEQVLDAVPGVEESAVIGAAHPDFGEGVLAIIVQAPGSAPDEPTLRAAAAAALANYKRPKAYLFTNALPRNTMGKVQKAALRAEHAQVFAPSGLKGAAE